MERVNVAEKLAPFHEYWHPKIVATINDYDVRIVKVKGEFVWHKHDDTDDSSSSSRDTSRSNSATATSNSTKASSSSSRAASSTARGPTTKRSSY
jgi:hypothetical protein